MASISKSDRGVRRVMLRGQCGNAGAYGRAPATGMFSTTHLQQSMPSWACVATCLVHSSGLARLVCELLLRNVNIEYIAEMILHK